MCVCVYFPSLGFAGRKLSVACVFVGTVSFLGLGFPSSAFCRAVFIDRYCLNLILS